MNILQKIRNGDTLGPVELIGWPEQGNQGDQGEYRDKGDRGEEGDQWSLTTEGWTE